MKTTRISECKVCSSREVKDQDKIYGQGKRLHNLGKAKSSGNVAWRCTVCGNRYEAGSGTVGS